MTKQAEQGLSKNLLQVVVLYSSKGVFKVANNNLFVSITAKSMLLLVVVLKRKRFWNLTIEI